MDPRRISLLRSVLPDFSQTSPQVMQFLANRYFGQSSRLRLAVIPEGQTLAEQPENTAVANPVPARPQVKIPEIVGR